MKFQYYIYIGLIILLSLIGIRISDWVKKEKNPITTMQPVITPVVQKIDKQGTPFSEVKQETYSKEQFNKMTDSIRKELKASAVKSISKEIVYIHDTIHTDGKTFYFDTTKKTIFDSYLDKNLYMEYTGNLSTHYGLFKFGLIPDTATYIETFKRHLFKANEYDLNIYHSNEYFQKAVIGGESYTFKAKKPVLVFGPYIGGEYLLNQKKFSPSIGVAIVYNLMTIKSK